MAPDEGGFPSEARGRLDGVETGAECARAERFYAKGRMVESPLVAALKCNPLII